MARVILFLAFVLLTFFSQPPQKEPQPAAIALSTGTTTQQEIAPHYKVSRVIDGDTIVVQNNGTQETLRLIGLNTPETVDPRRPVQCFGEEASKKAKELLDGVSVRIESDPSQDTHDKYGRRLAYVYLPSGELFNKLMIEEGYGHEYTYRVPYKFQREFKAAEQRAKDGQRGLWAPYTCAG